MFIRQFFRTNFRTKNGRRHAYWALVESRRTATGPRQHIVAWLGKLDEAGRLGVQQVADAARQPNQSGFETARRQPFKRQLAFEFDDGCTDIEPRWVEVNAAGVRVENLRQFGGPWLALHLIRMLQLDTFLKKAIPEGREHVPWDVTSLILIIARLLEPSSELFTAEQWYPKTALPELLGVTEEHVDDNRLYRALDQLPPHKEALEVHLKNRLGELFELEYDLLLYDVTSTFFEGDANFSMAQRGYSRDQRSDCKQVGHRPQGGRGLVVSRCGMPLGYEVFAGNTADVTTGKSIVETMERRYGKSRRIWVMDRGMVSEDNIAFLRNGGRRYIVGTPKSMLKKFEQEILKEDWHSIRDGLEVKIVPWPKSDEGDSDDALTDDSNEPANDAAKDDSNEPAKDKTEKRDWSPERFILCRSRERSQKEEGITLRFEKKIEESLTRMQARCVKQARDPMKVKREIGSLLGKNTHAAKLFNVQVSKTDTGAARIEWSKIAALRDWATLSAGCYTERW